MSDGSPRWYRSLYWRIALGLIAFLSLMLAAEGALFIWTTERIAGSMPARDPRRLAVLVASDVGAALAADPSLDLDRYLHDQYSRVFQTFLVIMRDGRVAANHDDVDEDILEEARNDTAQGGFPPRRFGRAGGGRAAQPPFGGEPGTPPGFPPPSDSPRDGRPGPLSGPLPDPGLGEPGPLAGALARRAFRAPPFRGAEVAAIFAGDIPVGRVAVLASSPPFARIMRELGPTMGMVAGGVLSVGTVLIALLVFGPVRRRLKLVQDATERLGAGDPSARAPEDGGDEVSAVARSFNRMADELTSRARALEASNRARRQLLADVSHELMTPLTAMRGYVETLTMADLQLDPPTRERYMRIVEEETHRLERIIGDLLDLARLEGGGGTLRREHVPVAGLFDRVASRHERGLEEHHVTLTRRIEPGAEQVIGDPDRLEQALQNLAANALRHSSDGGTIALEAFADEAGLHLVVRDTGPGILPEHLPLIFDRFYKADASRKAMGGSGLGLSIVKAIVERHGGSITARNEHGAVFEIVLPRQ